MQKLTLIQSLQQRLSPQQIQFMNLLQIPTALLENRIVKELEENPVLEEDENKLTADDKEPIEDSNSNANTDTDYSKDDYTGYKTQRETKNNPNEQHTKLRISSKKSLQDLLLEQLNFLQLDEREEIIGKQLIGSIDTDGYIRRDLEAIVNDLAFTQGIETHAQELEKVLFKIQAFDPPGIGARNLQECLALQLNSKQDVHEEVKIAKRIINECFEEFSKKHYEKIAEKLSITSKELLKSSVFLITKLNPKPGESENYMRAQHIIPDFILNKQNNKLEVSLNTKNAPNLKVSSTYLNMLHVYEGEKKKKDKKKRETINFIKQKLEAAQWFIDAIKQRRHTLLTTMQAIVDYQRMFFDEGDETKLKPMILKNIATKIQMDVSTVSRIANSKYVQTDFGIYSLKYFFSDSIQTEKGKVSNKEVKNKLKQMIDKENKKHPFSDDKLESLLKDMGYRIARRTVAKYREQLNIPVARLRKEL